MKTILILILVILGGVACGNEESHSFSEVPVLDNSELAISSIEERFCVMSGCSTSEVEDISLRFGSSVHYIIRGNVLDDANTVQWKLEVECMKSDGEVPVSNGEFEIYLTYKIDDCLYENEDMKGQMTIWTQDSDPLTIPVEAQWLAVD
ncbi:hypothetical protein K1X76_00665 [bacterium]|nr:hypothetical protein [bacterium]